MSFTQFVEDYREKPFSWGETDCMTFVRAGIHVQTGQMLGGDRDWGYTSEQGAKKALVRLWRAHSVSDVLAFFDQFFARIDYPSTLGTLIARAAPGEATTGYFMGFTISGSKGAFVGPDGLVFQSHEPADKHWKID